jgi:hypothetical protein
MDARAAKRLIRSGSDRYERVIALYPPAYRDAHGDVIRGTLLDAADARGGRAPLTELAGIAAHAVRLRLGLNSDAAVGRVAAAVAPLAAGSAVALSLSLLVFGEWAPWIIKDGHYHLGEFGPFFTLGSVAYLAWALIALAALAVGGALGQRIIRAGAGVAALLGLAVVPVAAVAELQRPPMFVLVTLALFGLLVVAGPRDAAQASDEFINVFLGVAGAITVGFSLTLAPDIDRYWNEQYWFYIRDTTPLATVIPALGTLAILGTAVLCRRDPRWLAATVVTSIAWAPYSFGLYAYVLSYTTHAWMILGQLMVVPAWVTFFAVTAATAAIRYLTRQRDDQRSAQGD